MSDPVYPTAIKMEVYIAPSWIDITADVVSDISANWGIPGATPNDRVASTGILQFTLRNDAGCSGNVAGYYSPSNASCLTGWTMGKNVRLSVQFAGVWVYKFYGHISKIAPDSGTWGSRRVSVTVLDYMDWLARLTLYPPADYQTNLRIDQIVTDIIFSHLSITPNDMVFGTGYNIFPYVYDTVENNTRALSEISKLVTSEGSYAYVRHSDTSAIATGETFIVEGRGYRYYRTIASHILELMYSDTAITEASQDLVQEDGSLIAWDELVKCSFANNMVSLESQEGTIFNKIVTTIHPRSGDASLKVLFTLHTVESLAAGEYKTFNVSYSDPNMPNVRVTAALTSGIVPGTDCHLNSKADGTGTTLDAFIDMGGTSYVSGATIIIGNGGSTNGFITLLQQRGQGVYVYEPITYTAEDTASEAAYGTSELDIDMIYQAYILAAKTMTDNLLGYKDPYPDVKSVNFLANTDFNLMEAFLYFDVGDLCAVSETQTGISLVDRFIQSVKFTIRQGGIIEFGYSLVPWA
jgi:hypothetical protein